MKRNLMLLGGVLFLIASLTVRCAKQQKASEGILTCLPTKSELGDWSPVGDPQTAVGEDLFLLINGGAEVYYEYGFKQAVIQGYTNTNEKSINLEMYEMEDAESAYGAYSFKTGKKGQEVALGNEGMVEDYYLNFWKGNFVVTLIGFDTDQETQDGLMALAKIIETNIVEQGSRPHLANVLLEAGFPKSGITYLEGGLALYNRYEFDTQNIFGVKKGVIGERGDQKIFVFKYDDENESMEWFEKARDHLRDSSRFSSFRSDDDGFSLRDTENRLVFVSSYGNYILVYVGGESSEARDILHDVKERIKNSFFDE